MLQQGQSYGHNRRHTEQREYRENNDVFREHAASIIALKREIAHLEPLRNVVRRFGARAHNAWFWLFFLENLRKDENVILRHVENA